MKTKNTKKPYKRYFEATLNEGSDTEKIEPKPKKQKSDKKAENKQKIIKIRTNLSRKGQLKTINKQKTNKIPRRVLLDPNIVKKYKKGDGITNFNKIKGKFRAKKIQKKEKAIEWAAEQAARAEMLLTEESGILEADSGETTTQFKQSEIKENVDITTATKSFELHLNDFGPYRIKYTTNGRHLLLGGHLGHVAAIDWVTKTLKCEMNVREAVYDVCWLHVDTMYAVAQKNWVYIYDNQGIEIHCIKKLANVLRMEFLKYHFLLATSSDFGVLSWLDISMGKMITQYNTKGGRLSIMTQNPWNANLCTGSPKGVVSMWSPNVREPLAKMLCHKSPITDIAVDPSGHYLATSAIDRGLKIWDIRQLTGPVQYYKLSTTAKRLSFSQRKLLAVGTENVVEVYKDCCQKEIDRAYLRHKLNSSIENVQFCPYEDVLGIGSSRGFTSLIVPGAGEPNFDAYEENPFQTLSQKREHEVKSLLEKIPPELICLDPNTIGDVDLPTLQDKIEAKKQLLFIKPPKINVEPRRKGGLKKGSVKVAQTKKIVKESAKREFLKNIQEHKIDLEKPKKKLKSKSTDPLDRFKSIKK